MKRCLSHGAVIAAVITPLAIALSAARPASAGHDVTRATVTEHHGCESTDNSPQSCIRVTFSGHRVRAITVGVGAHVRGGPYRGQYDIWDSARKMSFNTGSIIFPQNRSYFLGHTQWGPTYTNNGTGWTVPTGDKICGQFSQDNGDVSHPACATVN